MDNPNNNRHRNTYLVLIAAGVFLLVGRVVSFWTVTGILLLLLGVYLVRTGTEKRGYVMVAAGALFIAGGPLTVLIAILLILAGLFYKKSKDLHPPGNFVRRQSFVSSLRCDRDPWVLRSMSIWNAIGEVRLDLSLCMPEEKEVTLVLQGFIGNLDIVVPDEMGLTVEGSVYVGQLRAAGTKREGILSRLSWQTPNFASAGTRVKLIVTYIVGDVNIKIV